MEKTFRAIGIFIDIENLDGVLLVNFHLALGNFPQFHSILYRRRKFRDAFIAEEALHLPAR